MLPLASIRLPRLLLCAPCRMLTAPATKFAQRILGSWEWNKPHTSRLGHQFTHARQGWPFARTLKHRLKKRFPKFVSKQDVLRVAGKQKGLQDKMKLREKIERVPDYVLVD